MIPPALVVDSVSAAAMAAPAMAAPALDVVASVSAETAVSTATAVTSNLFVSLCSQLAPASSVMVAAAPLLTFRELQSSGRGVGSLPLLPYSTLAANCLLWTTYGIMQDTPAIWLPNGAGVLLAMYYILSYSQLVQKEATVTGPSSTTQEQDAELQQHVNGVHFVAGASLLAASLPWVTPDMVGQTAVLFCIALFASPLATCQRILQQKGGASQLIALPFTVASLVNTGLWSVSGVLDLHDIHVMIPNMMGFGFGLVQVALLAMYGGDETAPVSAAAQTPKAFLPASYSARSVPIP